MPEPSRRARGQAGGRAGRRAGARRSELAVAQQTAGGRSVGGLVTDRRIHLIAPGTTPQQHRNTTATKPQRRRLGIDHVADVSPPLPPADQI